MGAQTRPDEAVVIELPRELEGHSVLQAIVETIHHSGDRHVVVDFSRADVVGSATLSRLLELRRLLRRSGHRLVLCSVAPRARSVFSVAQLEKLFDFATDRCAALADLQDRT
ncbi:MAG: STAS domain-containing protein [Sedimentisphaerales bacterium]|nr:STAS domain-containing protein [Sedimentisphaerales bacterium]